MTIHDGALAGATSTADGPARAQAGERDIAALFHLAANAHGALMAGEVARYFEMIAPAPALTLMDPFGGTIWRGFDDSPELMEQRRRFFRGGTGTAELVAGHASGDLAVLVLIERARAVIGDVPEQDWALRVTLAFRREGMGWQLVHRHADTLVGGISVEEAAALARR